MLLHGHDDDDDWPLDELARSGLGSFAMGYRIYGGITTKEPLPDASISLILLINTRTFILTYQCIRRPSCKRPQGAEASRGRDHGRH